MVDRTSIIRGLKQEFQKEYGVDDCCLFFSPGRVNLIGEHIDYNGGMVLPAALSIGIYAAVRYRDDGVFRLRSFDFPQKLEIQPGTDITYREENGWTNYPAGVIKALLERGKAPRGFDCFLFSTLPLEAGLSSSASLEVLTTIVTLYPFLLDPASEQHYLDGVATARLCQAVENDFIGVKCGIMDQFAITMGKKDHAILLNTENLRYQYIPVRFGKYSLVIMNTNKSRGLGESKYNQRREECEQALNILREHIRSSSLVNATLSDLHYHLHDETLQKRARHVVNENLRVLHSVELLQNGEIEKFGKTMIASHESLRDEYEVTGAELDAIVEEALQEKSCIGARMTGAGFGGCAIALVETRHVSHFTKHVGHRYKQRTNRTAQFYPCDIDDGARYLE